MGSYILVWRFRSGRWLTGLTNAGVGVLGAALLWPQAGLARTMAGLDPSPNPGPPTSQPATNPALGPAPSSIPIPPPVSRSAPATPPPADTPYTLGPGDQVQMTLFRLPQYSGEFEVLVDGSLNLPLVGSIMVQNLSLPDATAIISQRYGQLLRRPIVSLNLTGRREFTVGVAGEVNRPGSYAMKNQDTTYPKLSQLLDLAGGITQSADLRHVQVRRQQAGADQIFTVNLWSLISTGDLRQDVTLRDGDSIFIPSTLVPLEEGPLLADASFYPDTTAPLNIAVIGEVFRPGPYRLQGGSTRTGDAGLPGGEGNGNGPVTVTDAIQVAGGIKPKANIQQIEIRRSTRSGGTEAFQVDLWKMLQTGDLKQNAILQEGDTVYIPTATTDFSPAAASEMATASFSPNTIQINVVGEVRDSGVVDVPPNTPLNQGILAAGGFNSRAREDSVLLVRLNPDGTVTQREIPIDFAQGINEESNPPLQNNDIIIVGETGLANFSDTLGSVASPIADFLYILGAPFRFLNLFN